MTEVARHALLNSDVGIIPMRSYSNFWHQAAERNSGEENSKREVNLFMHSSNLFFDQQAKANKGSSKRGRLKGDKIRMHFLQFMRVRVQSECL